MKKLVTAVLIVFLAGMAVGGLTMRYWRSLHGGPGEPSYESDLNHGVARSRQMKGVVALFGDSQTARLAPSGFSMPVENFGISGDRIAWVQASLPRYDLAQTRAIVLEIGINDLEKTDPQLFSDRYAAALRMLPPVPMVAMAVFPVRPSFAASYHDARASIADFNRRIMQACSARQGCIYLDLSGSLAGKDGFLLARYGELDGVHITPEALLLWREALERVLSPHLQ